MTVTHSRIPALSLHRYGSASAYGGAERHNALQAYGAKVVLIIFRKFAIRPKRVLSIMLRIANLYRLKFHIHKIKDQHSVYA